MKNQSSLTRDRLCQYDDMPRTDKLALALATFALAAALAGCTAMTAAPAAPPPTSTPAATPTPTPTYLTELPAWAKEASLWLVYPEGFECSGTEGCPNNYRAFFGEPGPVLPDGVEYYDPAKHDCTFVFPAGMDCTNHAG